MVVRRTSPSTFLAPLHWEPSLVFTCSWSDFFIEKADQWREEAWDQMLRTPQHQYQVLTKRTPRMLHWARSHPWPDHVWAGTSVESPLYKYRIDVLRAVPAAVRFLSVEPLLEDVGRLDLAGIGLVIVGGESGPSWRPLNLDWVRSVRDQCIEQDVVFHFKQGSGAHPEELPELDGRAWPDLPAVAEPYRGARV